MGVMSNPCGLPAAGDIRARCRGGPRGHAGEVQGAQLARGRQGILGVRRGSRRWLADDGRSQGLPDSSTKPVTISHIGARSLWDSSRLAPDNVLKACADKGGLIGIEAAPHTTITAANPVHSIDSYMEHFEYIKNLVGVDHVGFGPDSLYGDHAGLHRVYMGDLSLEESRKMPSTDRATDHPRVEYVRGVENPTEASHNILRWLVKKNYADHDIAKVIGGNALRVMKEVWE